jgi:uncharacterized protein (TIGR02246 family)
MTVPFRSNSNCFSVLLITSVFLWSTHAHADDGPQDSICPKNAHDRTTAQVLQAHASAFVAGDAALIACDYAEDAMFVLPGSVATGRTQIQATFGYFFSITGGNVSLSLHSLTIAGNAALLEYAVDSNHLVVSDGVDTFVVRHGLIVAQTAHLGGLSVK